MDKIERVFWAIQQGTAATEAMRGVLLSVSDRCTLGVALDMPLLLPDECPTLALAWQRMSPAQRDLARRLNPVLAGWREFEGACP
ncbi:hypothetical protein [Sabulicella rubraurantiaca]|uniref:hypothetical protein n=1 Tax=Sabulicella rubraurantiaca TaxID=2811429 RepID=UPI001A978BCC|nr:hypothetical protein [Sabulicella rubraurantiaca]